MLPFQLIFPTLSDTLWPLNEFLSALMTINEHLRAYVKRWRYLKNDIVRDAIIQRFKFTYELAWKWLKLWLEQQQLDARGPKDTLAVALQQGLIDDGNARSVLHEKRNLTTHTYKLPIIFKMDIVRIDTLNDFALKDKILQEEKAIYRKV